MAAFEVKPKRLKDGNWQFHDADTGEPLASSVKSGSGKYVEFHSTWSPHMIQMHPELAHPFHSFSSSSSENGVAGQVESILHKLAKNPAHKDFDYSEEDVNAEGRIRAHIIDKATNKKILKMSYPAYHKAKPHNSRAYSVYGSDVADKQVFDSAMKSENSPNNLSGLVNVARKVKEYSAGGGPRFTGHQTNKGDSRTKVYNTKIESPEAAIKAYADSKAIVNNHEFTKTMVSPTMMFMHRPDGQTHIISHQNGKIVHTSTDHSVPSYASKLDHVVESKTE